MVFWKKRVHHSSYLAILNWFFAGRVVILKMNIKARQHVLEFLTAKHFDTFCPFGHRLKLIFFCSGLRYMICVTLFCTLRESENTRCASQKTHCSREIRVILAWQRFFWLVQRAKTCYNIWYLWPLPMLHLCGTMHIKQLIGLTPTKQGRQGHVPGKVLLSCFAWFVGPAKPESLSVFWKAVSLLCKWQYRWQSAKQTTVSAILLSLFGKHFPVSKLDDLHSIF